MIQLLSWLDVADNSGARRAQMIGVIGKRTKTAGVGDIITANIKEAAPDGTTFRQQCDCCHRQRQKSSWDTYFRTSGS